MLKRISIWFFMLTLLNACRVYMRKEFEYPVPADTGDKKIELQSKRVFEAYGVLADNRFDAARLNDFYFDEEDSVFTALIKPENVPVNDSPWYAFKIWSDTVKEIRLQLKYENGHHRYPPKISADGKHWQLVDSVEVAPDTSRAVFSLRLSSEPVYISAQEIITSADTYAWLDSLAGFSPYIKEYGEAGKSALGRKIPFLKMGNSGRRHARVIVVFGRMHPPEVTGFIALQEFMETLGRKNALNDAFFSQYEIWFFPILNPDGVDLGHWRHNARGVDLNRDWAHYRQPEVSAVSKFILEKANAEKAKIMLGLDFHSMITDTYYLFDDSFHTGMEWFRRLWSAGIDQAVWPFKTNHEATPLSEPYAKTWFYMQFMAESVIYEVGDNTPRDLIKRKARAAAIGLMELLVEKK